MKSIIELSNVSFKYHDSEAGLKNINISIKEGERVAVVGKGGAGKTTFFYCIKKVIPCVYKGVLDGHIYLDNKSIMEYSNKELIEKISIILENFRMQRCSSTVEKELVFCMENLGFDSNTIEKRLKEIIYIFELTELLDTTMHTLSGGQCQKVLIASFLVLMSPIICLDNAASELDEKSKKKLYEIIDNYSDKYGITSIVAENDPRYFQKYDRVLIFDKGEIIGNITPKSLYLNSKWNQYYDYEKLIIPQICLHYNLAIPEDLNLTDENIQYIQANLKVRNHIETTISWEKKSSILEISKGEFRHGETVILKDINMEIFENDTLGIVGKNGVGKTTLLKIICGLYKLSEGILKTKVKGFGVVFQDVACQLFESSVKEEMCGYIEENKIYHALYEVGLEKKMDDDPLSLTKGEQKRLAIATIIAQDKDVIILDEPTSGLSGYEIRRLKEILRNLQVKGKTLIIVSHDMDFIAQTCDKMCVVYDKHIASLGYIRETLCNKSIMKKSGMESPDIVKLSEKMGYMVLSLGEFFEKYEKKY